MAMGPMLLNSSIRALAPCAMPPPGGAASLSACNAKNRNAAVKIGIHLTFNGIRQVMVIQVIEWMPPPPLDAPRPALYAPHSCYAALGFRSLSLLSRTTYERVPRFVFDTRDSTSNRYRDHQQSCSSSSAPRITPS